MRFSTRLGISDTRLKVKTPLTLEKFVEGIRANKLGLVKFLSLDVAHFDPAKPDAIDSFKVPESPQRAKVKPLGS